MAILGEVREHTRAYWEKRWGGRRGKKKSGGEGKRRGGGRRTLRGGDSKRRKGCINHPFVLPDKGRRGGRKAYRRSSRK